MAVLSYWRLTIVLVSVITGVTYRPVAAVEPGEESGRWLLDYGLAYGQTVSNPRAADAEFVLVWLEAAGRVSPELADAYMGQYDLLQRLGREDEALAALRNFCGVEPENIAARLSLFEHDYESKQTAEERIAICRDYLASAKLPVEVASAVHLRLAELCRGRGEESQFREEVRLAAEAFPLNTATRSALLEMQARLETPAGQVELLLTEMRSRRYPVQAAWKLAKLLQSLCLFEDAVQSYSSAAELSVMRNPMAGEPISMQLDAAACLFDAGDYEKALVASRKLLTDHPSLIDASMLLIRSARLAGRLESAEEEAAQLDSRLRAMELQAMEERSAAICHRIAEFHLDIVPDAHRALRFSVLTSEMRPESLAVKTTMGRSLAASGRNSEAVSVLSELAGSDEQAALALSQSLIALGRNDEAKAVLREAESIRRGGELHRRIVSKLVELGETPSPLADVSEVAELLGSFDWSVLQFAQKAGDVLRFEASFDKKEYTYGDPLSVTFELTNTGAYPIVLGDDAMMSLRWDVSIKDSGEKEVGYPSYLTITCEDKCVIKPGEVYRRTELLSTGRGHILMMQRPQKKLRMEFTLVLDPEESPGGVLQSRLGGILPVKLHAVRQPLSATAETVKRLADEVASGDVREGLNAIDALLNLIAEREMALQTQARHTYRAERVDSDRLTVFIRNGFGSNHSVVRARSLWAMAFMPMSDETIQAAAPLLSDGDWLTRLLAVEMLAKLQGPAFHPVLEGMSKDEDALVSRLASLYLAQVKEMGAVSGGK